MGSFLGVPIVIRGQVWGNLYLTEKRGADEFSEQDEEAAVILADWAAIAIGNAKLYESSERRRQEMEKAFRGLEATRDVAVAIGGGDRARARAGADRQARPCARGRDEPRDHAA